MVNIDDYADLAGTAAPGKKKQIPPEDEKFKACYIAGQLRKDETTGEDTIPGKLNIRGLKTNLDEVNFIITHIKTVLVNEITDQNNTMSQKTVCFSYQNGPRPWKGTSGRVCGSNRSERAKDNFCSTCRQQLIIAGIYCNDDGSPILNQGKPEFVFVKGKGIKYNNVSEYIKELSDLELDSFFGKDDEQTKRFEQQVVNHKRFVTKIGVESTKTNFGDRKIFKLTKGQMLDYKTTEKILDIAKKKLEDFNEKFDWSKSGNEMGIQSNSNQGQTSGPTENQKFETTPQQSEPDKPKEENKPTSFADVEF